MQSQARYDLLWKCHVAIRSRQKARYFHMRPVLNSFVMASCKGSSLRARFLTSDYSLSLISLCPQCFSALSSLSQPSRLLYMLQLSTYQTTLCSLKYMACLTKNTINTSFQRTNITRIANLANLSEHERPLHHLIARLQRSAAHHLSSATTSASASLVRTMVSRMLLETVVTA